MGTWLNVGFVQTEDLARLESELRGLLEQSGRHLVHPHRRTPERYDPMQYGHGEEAPRWGLAGFPAAPGWCALRTAPYELLIEPDTRLLSQLARRLGTVAFQYNLYDGTSDFLVEADAQGAFERSGVGSHHNWERLWGGEPPMDRLEARFRCVDPRPAARLARERWPALRVSRGGVHPSEVVLALAEDAASFTGESRVEAVRLVFGGENAEHCDNGFLVETLIPHAPLPVHPAFALYADRD